MYVLVRDARAFSCVGSGVDDLRLVHAAGEGVGRLPDSASTCVGDRARSYKGGRLLNYKPRFPSVAHLSTFV